MRPDAVNLSGVWTPAYRDIVTGCPEPAFDRLDGARFAPEGRAIVVWLCYDAIVRTTLDIPDQPYHLAKAIARDRNCSLGQVIGELILRAAHGATGAAIQMSDYGFPTFRCTRPVTSEDVKSLDDEE